MIILLLPIDTRLELEYSIIMDVKKPTKWQAILQDAIKQSGMTLKEIATQSGIDHGQLSRFMRNQRNLTITTAEKVGTLLGLELRKVKRRKR